MNDSSKAPPLLEPEVLKFAVRTCSHSVAEEAIDYFCLGSDVKMDACRNGLSLGLSEKLRGAQPQCSSAGTTQSVHFFKVSFGHYKCGSSRAHTEQAKCGTPQLGTAPRLVSASSSSSSSSDV
ncbi:hypothetical protein WMY93_010895 [Mugilogobius chulae]|uniref:Uncharacterized protein n=1 Tax=Mugilogobius chulae TaxID=88201 RepID=A0AAW0PBZ2_9GOBI